jgi:hypothetical protein
MMKEVPVLADEALGTRVAVIRTEHGSHTRILVQHLHNAPYSARLDDDIGIYEKKNIAACLTGAEVPSRRRTGVRY